MIFGDFLVFALKLKLDIGLAVQVFRHPDHDVKLINFTAGSGCKLALYTVYSVNTLYKER